jgi:hypothetical protein
VRTLKVDREQRVRLPNIKPGSELIYEESGQGIILLTEVTPPAAEEFPPGSLAAFVTEARDAEQLGLLHGCVHGPE